MATNTTIPAPLSWTPSSYWDGNDGSWNSFIVQIGTPAQEFRVLPSTADQETWIPVPEGCTTAFPDDPGYCGYPRGTMPVDGLNSSGFATNESSSWEQIGSGIYTLNSQEAELGYGGNGLYGLDTVVWGNSSSSISLTGQVVAGIADPSFWLGIAGIGPKPINFTEFNDPIDSFLSTLVNESKIPSLSWAYTAGAAYRDRASASLTLGGHDTNRYTGGLSIPMDADNSRPLLAAVTGVTGENTLNGTISLWERATMHFIDSTVPHIWVPENTIDLWTSAFGLTYDNETDLYLVNNTIHTQLLELNPTITFTLGATTGATVSSSQSIRLPYAAFDLEASYPFYTNATNYFPIRRAANSTQYTIGRTFFQEAYVIADFGRNNFTVAQASFDSLSDPRLVAISQPPANTTTSPTTSTSSKALSAGAIAGIAIGAVAGLVFLGLVLWFFFLIRKKRRHQQDQHHPPSPIPPPATPDHDLKPTLHSHNSELAADSPAIHEAHGSKAILHSELESPPIHNEVDGSTAKWGSHGVQELHTPPIPGSGRGYGMQELGGQAVGHESGYLVEAPGSEGRWAELEGSEAREKR
ncbi:Putative aspartic peptidase A1 family, aspartic peptidase domain superfamily [Septoria linicola]|uniref:Aspartic peptidase A1 family, aspartic peptidase domain superfamily n=1 Tax=Septoria linicola TaxID=215465 RepID=A0A9Q9EEJ7_9PEZI|nr:putative aspartic peptidase A1 family, aspartic peptidase domain superfamily [Septoria linicola]USW48871.1 Putative aspartic peptidase A1 family, aspartic peptidase domain superfamily [Septoria linicola]